MHRMKLIMIQPWSNRGVIKDQIQGAKIGEKRPKREELSKQLLASDK